MRKRKPALMIQGTSSDAGKSLIVAGLGRVFARRGLKVRPFKPQNMSNNAAVTKDGGEIGRAQALQARACYAETSFHMNPILLKPQSEIGAQIIVQGKVFGQATAKEYHRLKPTLLPYCLESYHEMAVDADLMILEGAGSPAEINLRQGDIANMGFARAQSIPVVLVGDIERGGVIAQLVGTIALMEDADRALIKAYLVNKFRGDHALFADGLVEITKRCLVSSAGIIPWFADVGMLPAEDALALSRQASERKGTIKIVVPVLPRISNFDDLDPLRLEPDVTLVMLERGKPIPGDADLVILAGSKSTIADLDVFRKEGWDIDLLAHYRRGGHVLGLCGGYQMLGKVITDKDGIEGKTGNYPGLGLLNIETRLESEKKLSLIYGRESSTGANIEGYEIHLGQSHGEDCARPMVTKENGESDGAISKNGRVSGCYVHGLFLSDSFRYAFLKRFDRSERNDPGHYVDTIETVLNGWADHLEKYVDIGLLWDIANGK